MLGSRWSPQSYATRDFLSRNQIPYHWIDVEQDAAMRDLALAANGGDLSRLPVVLLADGTMLVAPTHAELAAKVGCKPSRRGRSTTWRSSAPVRPGLPARCTARRKG